MIKVLSSISVATVFILGVMVYFIAPNEKYTLFMCGALIVFSMIAAVMLWMLDDELSDERNQKDSKRY